MGRISGKPSRRSRPGAAALLFFPGRSDPVRRIWRKRRVVMAAEREPEQFEHPAADLLLSFAKSRTVGDDQLGNVLRANAFACVAHEEVRQRARRHLRPLLTAAANAA